MTMSIPACLIHNDGLNLLINHVKAISLADLDTTRLVR